MENETTSLQATSLASVNHQRQGNRMSETRQEHKQVVSRRIAFFRNEMNKAWIGAKKADSPRAAMMIKVNRLLREHHCEKAVVRNGVRQWWEKKTRKVGKCPC
jgi:hypothetical protein